MEGTSKKVQSGNDRQKKFKEKNPNLVKLNQLKQSLARTKIKEGGNISIKQKYDTISIVGTKFLMFRIVLKNVSA